MALFWFLNTKDRETQLSYALCLIALDRLEKRRRYFRDYQESHQTQLRANAEKYYQQHRREKLEAQKLYSDRRYLLHRDAILEQRKARRQTPEFQAKSRDYQRKYRHRNPEKNRNYVRESYRRHIVERRSEGRLYSRAYRKYLKSDPAAFARHRAKVRAYEKVRKASDPVYRAIQNFRRNLHNRVKRIKPLGKLESVIGCPINELRDHLASQFTKGMNWENYGEWHIDHRLPLSAFDCSKPNQFQRANHYTNLQPMWSAENIRKSDKILSKYAQLLLV